MAYAIDPAGRIPRRRFQPDWEGEAQLGIVVHSHYTGIMKTAVIPQVRVEPQLRADLDAVLLPGETLTEFVEASVRRAVEFLDDLDTESG